MVSDSLLYTCTIHIVREGREAWSHGGINTDLYNNVLLYITIFYWIESGVNLRTIKGKAAKFYNILIF